jgi:hypothetical protein
VVTTTRLTDPQRRDEESLAVARRACHGDPGNGSSLLGPEVGAASTDSYS